MPVIIFLFMNFLVLASSFLLVYKLLRVSDFVDALICWFIFYFAQIIFSGLLLGGWGVLYLKNVILFNLAILLLVWLISRNKESSFSLIGVKNSLTELLNNKVVLLSVCVILGFGITKVFINLVNPPFGWDSLNYHFTFPVEWLKHGNLDNPITIFDDPSPSYYPINGSLFFFWLALPLKNVFLADLGQIPFFVLAFLAVYSMARKLNLNKESSFLSACLFTLIPNYFKQLEIAYVDVMVAGLFLAALNWLFLLKNEFSLKNILIYSIVLGLLLGIKTVALPYSILLFTPFIYLYLKNIKRAYPLIIPVIPVLIIFGGFTYMRNFIDTGNPLYPLDLKLFGKTVFNGVMDNAVYRAHFRIEDYSVSKLLFREGLGAQSLLFVLPAVFLGLPVALIKRKKLGIFDLNLRYFLILPILIYLVYRYIIPLANTRYLYPLLGIGVIIGLYAARLTNIPPYIIRTLAVICVFASMSELAKRQELIVSIISTFILFFSLPFLLKSIRIELFTSRPLRIFLFLIFIIMFFVFLEKDYSKNEYPRYVKMTKYSGFWPDAANAWEWLNQGTSGSNIAYAGRPVPFPLYGTNFKNDVFYVSLNRTEPAKLHYFPDARYRWNYDFLSLHRNLREKGNYRSNAEYLAWVNNLLKRGTDYLFVYSLHQTKDIRFPLEDSWAKADPKRFSPVFTNETIHIYKISK